MISREARNTGASFPRTAFARQAFCGNFPANCRALFFVKLRG
jgi:hypothetical protein